MTVDPAVLEELDRLRARLPEVSGSVLASTDGLVIAHDAYGIEPDWECIRYYRALWDLES